MTGSAKQSILPLRGKMDCFVAYAPRNDGKDQFRSPGRSSPVHVVFQIVKAGSAYPFIASTFGIVVAGGVALVLDIRTVKFGELRPTRGAVIMVPAFAPASVTAKLQFEGHEMASIIDPPLLV